VYRELVLEVAGVECGRRLEQQDPAFFISDGFVLDPARNHDELAFFEPDGLVAELDPEPALHHQEHLIFVVMVMPDEFAIDLGELDLLTVQFAGNVRLVELVDLGEFLGEVNFVHDLQR